MICCMFALLISTSVAYSQDITIDQLTTRELDDMYPSINENGDMVWSQKIISDTRGYNIMDSHIYYYDRATGTTTQISSGSFYNQNPQMSNNGTIVWEGYDTSTYVGGSVPWQIYLYDGTTTTQLTNGQCRCGHPQVNDRGEVVWWAFDGTDRGIFLYNGTTTRKISDNDYASNRYPKINNAGQVVWDAHNGTGFEIYFYDGATTKQITSTGGPNAAPDINNRGEIVWHGYDNGSYKIYLYDGSSIRQISDNSSWNVNPKINDDGHVVWEGKDSSGRYVINYYDGSTVVQIPGFNNGYYSGTNPHINNMGDITWEGYDGNDWNVMLTTSYRQDNYYDSGRKKYIVSIKPDTNGNIYLHYLDEDWGGQGNGRPDKEVKEVADSNGAKAYQYFYHENSDVVRIKYAYGTADYSADPTNPTLSNIVATFEYAGNGALLKKTTPDGTVFTHYLNDANRLKSKTLASPDFNGYVYYEYLDEDYNGQGHGRVDKTISADPDANGAKTHAYTYWATTVQTPQVIKSTVKKPQLVSTKRGPQTIWTTIYVDTVVETAVYVDTVVETSQVKCQYDYATDDCTGLTATREYDAQGTLIKTTFSDRYTYYASKRKESAILAQPDASGNICYHYQDEDWNGQGYGRIDKQILASPDSDGARSYTYQYPSAVDDYTKLLLHLDGDYSDSSPSSHTVTNVGSTIDDGKFDGGASFYGDDYLTVPDSADWGFGINDFTVDICVNLSKINDDQFFILQYNEENPNDRWGFLIDSTNNLVFVNTVDGVDIANYVTKSPLSVSTGTWYHIAVVRNGASCIMFLDGISQPVTELTAFGNLTDTGALMRIGAHMTNHYLDSYIDELRISKGIARWTTDFTPSGPYAKRISYKNTDYTGLVATYEYDPSGWLVQKTDEDGNVEKYYESGRKKSELKSKEDENGCVYYGYLDEDYHGRGYGRVSKKKRVDGTHESIEYWGDTGTVKIHKKNARDGREIESEEYYSDSKLKKKTHANGDCETYYSSGRRESVRLAQPDSAGNAYYHYCNEDWGGKSHGRVDKTISADPDTSGATAHTYTYWTNTIRTPQVIKSTVQTPQLIKKTVKNPQLVSTKRGPQTIWTTIYVDTVVETTVYVDTVVETTIYVDTVVETSQIKYQYDYANDDCADLIATREYDAAGALVKKTEPTLDTTESLQRNSLEQTVASQFSDHFTGELANQPATQDLLPN